MTPTCKIAGCPRTTINTTGEAHAPHPARTPHWPAGSASAPWPNENQQGQEHPRLQTPTRQHQHPATSTSLQQKKIAITVKHLSNTPQKHKSQNTSERNQEKTLAEFFQNFFTS
jgi:hypothetical protein